VPVGTLAPIPPPYSAAAFLSRKIDSANLSDTQLRVANDDRKIICIGRMILCVRWPALRNKQDFLDCATQVLTE
jgi:hypothetical protein